MGALDSDAEFFAGRLERFEAVRRFLDIPDSLIGEVHEGNKRCHGLSPSLNEIAIGRQIAERRSHFFATISGVTHARFAYLRA
ncbi:MAG TPA: hypothetical protein VN639_19305, partial [Azonexus sp.]|nr:hypothetical protein [Azonexus sp.]